MLAVVTDFGHFLWTVQVLRHTALLGAPPMHAGRTNEPRLSQHINRLILHICVDTFNIPITLRYAFRNHVTKLCNPEVYHVYNSSNEYQRNADTHCQARVGPKVDKLVDVVAAIVGVHTSRCVEDGQKYGIHQPKQHEDVEVEELNWNSADQNVDQGKHKVESVKVDILRGDHYITSDKDPTHKNDWQRRGYTKHIQKPANLKVSRCVVLLEETLSWLQLGILWYSRFDPFWPEIADEEVHSGDNGHCQYSNNKQDVAHRCEEDQVSRPLAFLYPIIQYP